MNIERNTVISMKQLKKAKGILLSLGLVCLLSLSFFLGGMAMAQKSESQAVAAAKGKLERRSEKDMVSESEEFLDNSRSFAQELLQEHGDAPLLDSNAETGEQEASLPEGIAETEGTEVPLADSHAETDEWALSLESILNDVNAGHGAREAILAVCTESGLDAKAAQIKDLTEEQIMEADQETFRTSEHPLGN